MLRAARSSSGAKTPSSVMMPPVMRSWGVTSKAGFQTSMPAGEKEEGRRQVCGCENSQAVVSCPMVVLGRQESSRNWGYSLHRRMKAWALALSTTLLPLAKEVWKSYAHLAHFCPLLRSHSEPPRTHPRASHRQSCLPPIYTRLTFRFLQVVAQLSPSQQRPL